MNMSVMSFKRPLGFLATLMMCVVMYVGVFNCVGCDEEDAAISAGDPKAMPTANEARQAINTIRQVKQTSQSVQARQESFMRLVVFVLIIIGIALPLLFWLLQRKFLSEQEHRLVRKLEKRETDIKNEIVELERKMLDVTQQQRQQLIAELELLREKSVELDRTTREMFSEALHNFKNTRILKRPGFFARLFGLGRDRMHIPDNTTIVQIHRADERKAVAAQSPHQPAKSDEK